jgi:hypothetical protein
MFESLSESNKTKQMIWQSLLEYDATIAWDTYLQRGK